MEYPMHMKARATASGLEHTCATEVRPRWPHNIGGLCLCLRANDAPLSVAVALLALQGCRPSRRDGMNVPQYGERPCSYPRLPAPSLAE